MANLGIVGFQPAYTLSGADIAYERVQATSNNTLAIYCGDPVSQQSDGTWYVTTAGSGNPVGSICCGAWYVNAAGKLTKEKYLPAATTYTATDGEDQCNWLIVVKNVQDVVFEATVSAATPIAIAQTDLGLNYDFALGTGSTTTGLSGAYLNSTGRTTTTLQFHLNSAGFVRRANNDRTAVNPRVFCQISIGQVPALSQTGT